MAAKLNKTMRELLLSATTDLDQFCVDSGYFTGARRDSFGHRKLEAAEKLADMNLTYLHKYYQTRHYINGNRTTCHSSERIFRLTDEGLKLVEELRRN